MNRLEATINELASFFQIPPPRYVLGSLQTAGSEAVMDASTYTIHFSSTSPSLAVVAHEMAHATHVYYGIACKTPVCEAFASIFEEYWLKRKGMGGRSHPVFSCSNCRYPVFSTGGLGKCLRCKSTYSMMGEGMHFICSYCRAPVKVEGIHAVCRCGYVYRKIHGKPEIPAKKIVGTTLTTALGSAILASTIYGKFPPKTREEVSSVVGAFTAGGFVALLVSLMAIE